MRGTGVQKQQAVKRLLS